MVFVMAKEVDTHPLYGEFQPDWNLMRDSYKGQRVVKAKGTQYLPYTSSQIADGVQKATDVGSKAYASYLLRARYPNFVRQAVQTAIGMMHSLPPKITVPKELENMSTTRGETLEQLLRRINEEQLISGRIGLLLDIPSKGAKSDTPYIATYNAESIVNWDNGDVTIVPQSLNLVVLDESEYERTDSGFSWTEKEKYRVLNLGDPREIEQSGVYTYAISEEGKGDIGELNYSPPSYRGRTLQKIPFVFCNSCDLVVEPDEPPLLDLANLCMTIYRGEADYRQNLFMQGQDTLVTIGANIDEDEPLKTGAGARIDVPLGGDAKYVGVTSDGLQEQREALENDRKVASMSGAQTLDTVSRERESGDSLRIRVAARTADLNQVAATGAKALEDLLKIAAEWVGADPTEVKVIPNTEFGEPVLTGQSMVEYQTARNLGFPISARSLHQVAVDKGLTTKTFEEEMEEAKKEKGTIFEKAENGDRAPAQVDNNPNTKNQPKDPE